MKSTLINVKIIGSGSYLPENKETVEDFIKKGASKDIVYKLGIMEHRVIGAHETITDMEVKAAEIAIESAGIKPKDIDLIISSSAMPKQIGVPNSNPIQHRLGAVNAGTFDVVMACASVIPQILIAANFIASGQYRYILLTGSSNITSVSDPTDPASFIVLGDGAGAIVMGPTDKKSGIISFDLKSRGEYFDYCGVKIKKPKNDVEGIFQEKLYFYIGDLENKSSSVSRYLLTSLPAIVSSALTKAGLSVSDIDFLISHQNASILVDNWIKALGVPPEKIHLTYPKYGNMTNANIFVNLDEVIRMKKIKEGDIVVFAGQGAGFSVGSIVMRW